MRLLFALVLCALTCMAEVRVHLSTASGRSSFFMGEGIEVALRFEAEGLDGAGDLRVIDGSGDRAAADLGLDQFIVTPEEGAEDPLRDRYAYEQSMGPCSRVHLALDQRVKVFLNEWVSFRRPGKYTVMVRSRRLVRLSQTEPEQPVWAASNVIEIEIQAPPPGWVAETLANARMKLAESMPLPGNSRWNDAVRTIRYLETPEAARVMVELSTTSDLPSMTRALWTNPHRNVVIEAMEKQLAEPETSVNIYWLETLARLSASREMPYPPPRIGSREYGVVYSKYREQYNATALRALPRKQGWARVQTAMTLHRNRAPIPLETMRQILLSAPEGSHFDDHGLFADLWPVIASPEIGPFVERFSARADRTPAPMQRLYEIDPEKARALIIEQIRTGGPSSLLRTHFILPDRELPELDEYFIEQLESGNPPWALIDRYATRQVRTAVLHALDSSSGGCVSRGILYLLRVNPEEGRRRLAAFREKRPDGIQCSFSIPDPRRAFISEGLEDVLIADLAGSDAEARRSAVGVLGDAGAERAEPHLWRAMEKWRASLGEPPAALNSQQQGEEHSFQMALLSAWGWTVTPERLDRFVRLCVSDGCRTSVANRRKSLDQPVQLYFSDSGGRAEFSIGGSHTVTTREQLRERIRKYPPGTEFTVQLPYRGTWAMDRLERQLRESFDAEGRELQVKDRPAAGP